MFTYTTYILQRSSETWCYQGEVTIEKFFKNQLISRYLALANLVVS